MKITISFKPNEIWLYNEICKHSGKSNWVKDILADYLKDGSISTATNSNNVKLSPSSEFDGILGNL